MSLRWSRALAKDYGHDEVVFSGPVLAQTSVGSGGSNGVGTITLTFDHAADGLVSRDGEPLSHFEIAGADDVYYPAVAVIRADVGPSMVEVSSESVEKPASVRYAWHEAAIGNLANSEGLPASPFRTKR